MNNLTTLEHNTLTEYLDKNPITLENEDLCVTKDLIINNGGVFYPDTWNDDTEKYNYAHLLTMTQFAKLVIEEYEAHREDYATSPDMAETVSKLVECEALLEVTANQE